MVAGGCESKSPGRWERRAWHVFLPSWYKVYCVKARSRYKVAKWPGICPGGRKLINGHWRSVAAQIVSEQEICLGAGFLLRAAAGVRVPRHYGFVLVAGEVCKNRDKQLTFIVRVISRNFILVKATTGKFKYSSIFLCMSF